MKRVALNDGFHRLVAGGLSAGQAWRKLTTALTADDHKLWCDGNPLSSDYVANHLRFTVRDGDIVVMPAGPLGWAKPVNEYVFEIDGAEFGRLLLPLNRHDLKDLTLREAQRRERENLVVNAGVLHRWLDDLCTDNKGLLPTSRSVRVWLAAWRNEQKLVTAPAKSKRK
jgi:hypothetical protein